MKTNRQMSAAFKKLGFKKSSIQMTRTALSYELEGSPGLFTFGKGQNDRIMVTGLKSRYPGFNFVLLTSESWQRVQENPWIYPYLFENRGNLNQRSILLAVAAGYRDFVEFKKTGIVPELPESN